MTLKDIVALENKWKCIIDYKADGYSPVKKEDRVNLAVQLEHIEKKFKSSKGVKVEKQICELRKNWGKIKKDEF
jgi:hypothetical protein